MEKYFMVMLFLAIAEVFTAQSIILVLAFTVSSAIAYGFYLLLPLPYIQNIGLIPLIGVCFLVTMIWGQIAYLKGKKHGTSWNSKL